MIAEHVTNDGCEDPTELLTAGDLAKRLRVSIRQIRRLDKSGSVPAPLRIGGVLRWHAETIDRWLKSGAPVRSAWEQQQATQTVGNENT